MKVHRGELQGGVILARKSNSHAKITGWRCVPYGLCGGQWRRSETVAKHDLDHLRTVRLRALRSGDDCTHLPEEIWSDYCRTQDG